MRWRGRRQSKNVIDMRIHDPMVLTQQRLNENSKNLSEYNKMKRMAEQSKRSRNRKKQDRLSPSLPSSPSKKKGTK